MGNNISSCEPILDRADKNYFPGNTLSGNIRIVADENVSYYAIRLEIIATAFFWWATPPKQSSEDQTTHEKKHIFSKTVITVAGDAENSSGKNTYALLKGEHFLPFSVVLSPATLPTVSIDSADKKFRIFYEAVAVVEVAGRLNQAGKQEFNVYSPMPFQLWNQPSAKHESFAEPITGCCCCSNGEISARCSVSKTVVSLDRDTIDWTVFVENHSENLITDITASMAVTCLPKLNKAPSYLKKHNPSETHFPDRVLVNIPSGETGQAQGKIKLAPGAPASLISSVCDIVWRFVVVITTKGCCTTNPRLSIPIQAAHCVFDGQAGAASQYILQQQQNFQPIVNAEMLNQAGMWEVPNMAAPNSPAFRQLPPLPPPGGNYYQLPNNNNNTDTSNMAISGSVPSPPLPEGQGFPGLATYYPEGEYFIQSSASGQFAPETPKKL